MSGETSAGYSQPTLCSANVDTYDKVTHKIDDNAITVTLMKDKRRLERVDKEPKPTGVPIDVHCFDRKGDKCKKDCPKINVMHNQRPPPKKPHEELIFLRTLRQITPAENLKQILDVELNLPRNYVPLPGPGPRPPIIKVKRRKPKPAEPDDKKPKKAKEKKKRR